MCLICFSIVYGLSSLGGILSGAIVQRRANQVHDFIE